MDIATEEFSHLEIVGATITMLLNGVNGELKDAVEQSDLTKLLQGHGRQGGLHPQGDDRPAIPGAHRRRAAR